MVEEGEEATEPLMVKEEEVGVTDHAHLAGIVARGRTSKLVALSQIYLPPVTVQQLRLRT